MRAVAVRGRWAWRLSGLVTLAALGIPLGGLIVSAGQNAGGVPDSMSAVPTRTITIEQPITSLSVESYGAAIYVKAGPVHRAQVIEAITYSKQPGGPPAVTAAVSHGHLTLSDPDCQWDCSVGFTITVPSDVAVTAESDDGPITVVGVAAAYLDSSGGPVQARGIGRQLTVNSENGPIMVSGAAAANLDSGGGPVGATGVTGPLTVSTEGGALTLDGLSGPLNADTGGAPLLARGVAAVTATVNTENGSVDMAFTAAPQMVSVDTGGGDARLAFAAPPQSVTVSTDGGLALLTVPGAAYAVSADSGGGPQVVAVATNPAAPRSIIVTTGGGPLRIEP